MKSLLRTPNPLLSLSSLLLCLMLLAAQGALADTAGDKKRAQLAGVKRVAVIPPFFGTDTLSKGRPQGEPNDSKPAASGAAANKETSLTYLRKLQAHVDEALPQQLAQRTPFTVIPAVETAQALKDLKLTPEKLFENDGMMQGSHFALPVAD